MSSSCDEDDSFEVKPDAEIPIDYIKVEDTDIQYEFVEYSEVNSSGNRESECESSAKEDSTIESECESGDNVQSEDNYLISEDDSVPKYSTKLPSKRINPDPDYVPETSYKLPPTRSDFYPDYVLKTSTKASFVPLDKPAVVNGRIQLKHYKRKKNSSGCLFKDCNLKETALIPNIVRIRTLQEYKLYIPQLSKACSIHLRDQNWEELLEITYNDFTATDVADILQMLKEASQVSFNFETIELIPTRYIRFWMNVNKVQFQRIFDKFPHLKTLKSPKTALAVYLMYLQNSDFERIALLLQTPEDKIMEIIQSVQVIVPCQNYEELNKMFKLEY